jgi:hypothetical protein
MNEKLRQFLENLAKKEEQKLKSDTTNVYVGGTIPKKVEGDPRKQVVLDENGRELFQ